MLSVLCLFVVLFKCKTLFRIPMMVLPFLLLHPNVPLGINKVLSFSAVVQSVKNESSKNPNVQRTTISQAPGVLSPFLFKLCTEQLELEVKNDTSAIESGGTRGMIISWHPPGREDGSHGNPFIR